MSLFPESRPHEVPRVRWSSGNSRSFAECASLPSLIGEWWRLPITLRRLGMRTREDGGVVCDVDEIQTSGIPSRIHSTFVLPQWYCENL